VAVVAKSALERTLRLDAEFFKRDFTAALATLSQHKREALTDVTKVSDGNHFTISDCYADEGIPYYRGQDISGTFFAEQANATFITPEAYQRPYMKRSHLQRGDVLLSIVGTIGSVSLVDSNDKATCSCKLAILRPKSILPEYLAAYLSSSFGQNRIRQLTRGALQGGLTLVDMDQFDIPRFGELEGAIADVIQKAKAQTIAVAEAQQTAEAMLIDALGLGGWSPPEPLTYIRSAAAVRAAGRYDAEFAAPAVQALIARLAKSGETVGSLAAPRRDRFKPTGVGDFNYIEISDIGSDGRCSSSTISMNEAPSRATWTVQAGDVITSTVRPNRRLSAIIAPDQNDYIGTSGLLVLKPQRISPEALMTYLRLPIICDLMGLYTTSSMYPAIADRDILALPCLDIVDDVEQAIIAAVKASADHIRRSQSLLITAKRAVEIAIEDSEAAALAFLASSVHHD
jgi:type I restriction enzyme, S subunit